MNSWQAYELNLQKTLSTFSKDCKKQNEPDIKKDLEDMNLISPELENTEQNQNSKQISPTTLSKKSKKKLTLK